MAGPAQGPPAGGGRPDARRDRGPGSDPDAPGARLPRPGADAAARGPSADPRTLRTRARLRAALLAECEEYPLDQVGVSAVARRAGVGRATFYLHYEGVLALAVDACADVVREAVSALHAWTVPPAPGEPPEPLTEFLTAVDRRAALYRTLLPEGGGGPLGALLHRELRAYSEAARVRAGAPHPEFAASATAAAFTGLLADWLHGHVVLGPPEFALHVWRLLRAIHAAVR